MVLVLREPPDFMEDAYVLQRIGGDADNLPCAVEVRGSPEEEIFLSRDTAVPRKMGTTRLVGKKMMTPSVPSSHLAVWASLKRLVKAIS